MIGGLSLIAGAVLLIVLNLGSGLLHLALAGTLVGLGMGFCNQTFLLVIQSSVDWKQRGTATASAMILRTIGQSLGAAIGGAMLNFSVARYAPQAGDAFDRLLDPARRSSLGADAIARLSEAIAGSLHDVYIVAGVLAVLTLAATLLVPAHLSPANPAKAQT
jgi:hypothetical protein